MITPQDHINRLETLKDMMKKEIALIEQYLEGAKKGMKLGDRTDLEKLGDEVVMRRHLIREKQTYTV